MRLPLASLALLVAPVSGLMFSAVTAAPRQQLLQLSRRSPPAMKGNFEGFSFDTLYRSFGRLTDLRVARASHILVKGFDEQTVAQMNEWKADINNDPEKFAARAEQNSVCPSRAKGGDLGFFTRGKMVREFDDLVFTAKPGMVHGPVRTDVSAQPLLLRASAFCSSPC